MAAQSSAVLSVWVSMSSLPVSEIIRGVSQPVPIIKSAFEYRNLIFLKRDRLSIDFRLCGNGDNMCLLTFYGFVKFGG